MYGVVLLYKCNVYMFCNQPHVQSMHSSLCEFSMFCIDRHTKTDCNIHSTGETYSSIYKYIVKKKALVKRRFFFKSYNRDLCFIHKGDSQEGRNQHKGEEISLLFCANKESPTHNTIEKGFCNGACYIVENKSMLQS